LASSDEPAKPGKNQNKQTELTDGADMNAAETKKKFEAKSYYGDSGKYSPQTHWKRRMGELYGPKFFLSNKDAGQLKHLVAAWGDDTKTLVDFAFDNWSKFAHRVKAEAGLTQVAVSPQLGFLVTYKNILAGMHLQSIAAAKENAKAKKAMEESGTKPAPAISSPSSASVASGAPIATWEECLAIMEQVEAEFAAELAAKKAAQA
jgi:hypothetical protein